VKDLKERLLKNKQSSMIGLAMLLFGAGDEVIDPQVLVDMFETHRGMILFSLLGVYLLFAKDVK
jgi:hypothetical protein